MNLLFSSTVVHSGHSTMTPVPKNHVSHRGLTAWAAYTHDGIYQVSSIDFSNNVVKVEILVPSQGGGKIRVRFSYAFPS